MLWNDVDDLLRQAGLPGHLDTVLDVGGDDQGGHRRRQAVMRIESALVLDEVLSMIDLADVVIEGAHAAQQAVGADRVGGLLGQRSDCVLFGLLRLPVDLPASPARLSIQRHDRTGSARILVVGQHHHVANQDGGRSETILRHERP